MSDMSEKYNELADSLYVLPALYHMSVESSCTVFESVNAIKSLAQLFEMTGYDSISDILKHCVIREPR